MKRLIRGYVLAGGESSRMQADGLPVDKALLPYEGETLLERSLRLLTGVCGESRILCGPASRCARLGGFGASVPDRYEGVGPLGGLDAALRDASAAGAESALIVPVDQPLMTAPALRGLLSEALQGNAQVACFETEGRPQPLPLLIRCTAAPMVERALRAGDYKLLPVLRSAARELAPDGDLCLVHTDRADWFHNLNSPGDIAELLRFRTARHTGASD